MADYDLAIIGGGLLGVSIARDAAGRGLRVYLAEQNDLASGASHALFRLMDGGFDARGASAQSFSGILTTRAVLAEREIWLRIAPHLVRPLRLVRPNVPPGESSGRTLAGLSRLQLFFQDRLGARSSLDPASRLDLTHHPVGVPLKRPYGSALDYGGCVADAARLVALSAVDAAARGAVIKTGTRVARAERGEEWRLAVVEHGERHIITARALINATGAWTGESIETVVRRPPPPVRLVKYGSVLVPRLYDGDHGYHLDDGPNRAIFVVPFGAAFTQIGCSIETFSGDVAMPAVSGREIVSLCATVSRYFRQKVEPDNVAGVFAAVGAFGKSSRPVLQLDKRFREAPLVTIHGGSPVLARRIADMAMARLLRFFVMQPSWTATEPLPGGDFAAGGFDDLVADIRFRWPFLDLAQAQRLSGAYGTRVEAILGGAQRLSDLGETFGDELSAREVGYLMDHEWARTPDDVLSRRSHAGLTMPAEARQRLAQFMLQP